MSGPKFTMAAMTDEDRATLRRLLREVRVAHLGTLRDAAPMVSMTLFLPAADLSLIHVHVSRLAWHTQDMGRDPRIALSIAQNDDARADPFTLARVTLRGSASPLANGGAAFEALKQSWLARYPESAINFTLADFSFWAIRPQSARFVAGFGRIHNLSAQALAEAVG